MCVFVWLFFFFIVALKFRFINDHGMREYCKIKIQIVFVVKTGVVDCVYEFYKITDIIFNFFALFHIRFRFGFSGKIIRIL